MSNSDKLANLGIMIVAISALVVSIWQMRATETHNRLTVKPLMDYIVTNDDSTRSISIKNAGIGPAIITEMCYKYKSKDCLFMDEALEKAGAMDKIFGMYNYGANTVVAANENLFLLRFRGHKMYGIELKMTYESIYGDVFEMILNI